MAKCSTTELKTNRRQVMQGATLTLLASTASGIAAALPAGKGQTPGVGSYLPSATGTGDSFVEYKPDAKKTPVSLRQSVCF